MPSEQRGAEGNLRATKLSYFSRLTDAATFIRLATIETHRRGVEQALLVAAVNDGADWIQLFIDVHARKARRVLDVSHASSYVHSAGHTSPDGKCGSWCDAQMTELLTGEPKVVLEALAELSESLTNDAPSKAIVEQSQAYLAKREEQIQYRLFREEGLPIGSGIVESANKLVMEARCKGAGMHWRQENVNPILALRCAYLSGHWQTSATLAQTYLRIAHNVDRATRRCARNLTRRTRNTPPKRPPTIVNGRPTKDHPYNRRPAVTPRSAKL